jgi:hypothetical protein
LNEFAVPPSPACRSRKFLKYWGGAARPGDDRSEQGRALGLSLSPLVVFDPNHSFANSRPVRPIQMTDSRPDDTIFEKCQSPACDPAGTERASFVWGLIALGLSLRFLATLYGPYFQGMINVTNDLGTFHMPQLRFVSECLKSGESPWWNDRFFAGFSLVGEGQLALFHPLRSAAYATLDFPFAFMTETILPLILMQAGLWSFLRNIGVSRGAALAGSYMVVFSCSVVGRWFHMNYLFALAHTPWTMLFFDRFVRAESRTGKGALIVAIALTKASQIAFGSPPPLVYGTILELSWLAVAACESRKFGRAAAAAGAFAAGVLLSAPQLLSQLSEADLSIRSAPVDPTLANDSVKTIRDVSFVWFEEVFHLLQPFDPFVVGYDPGVMPIYHEFYVCAGGVVLLTVLYGMMFLDVPKRIVVWFVTTFLLSMFLSYLTFVPVLHSAFRVVPILGGLRINQRFGVIGAFALGVTFAVVIDTLFRIPPERRLNADERRRFRLVAGGFVAMASAAPVSIAYLGIMKDRVSPQIRTNIELVLSRYPAFGWQVIGPILVVLTAIVLDRGIRRKHKAHLLTGLCIFQTALLCQTVPHPYFLKRTDLGFDVAAGRAVPDYRIAFCMPEVPGELNLRLHEANVMMNDRIAVNGYRALWPLSYRTALTLEELRLASVDRIVVSKIRPLHYDESDRNMPGLRRDYSLGEESPEIVAVENPMPRFRLVPRTVVNREEWPSLHGIDPATTVVIDAGMQTDAPTPGHVFTLRVGGAEKTLQVQCDAPQTLVISDSWHPGWKAYVDSTPVPVAKAYGRFQAVSVPAGLHQVRLVFAPDSVRVGRRIAWGGLLALVILSGFAVLRME